MGNVLDTSVERNWLAGVLDDIERYAHDNGLPLLLDEVRSARIVASLDADMKTASLAPAIRLEGLASIPGGARSVDPDDLR